MSYAGCVYQFLLKLKQFLQSYNKKFQHGVVQTLMLYRAVLDF